MSELRIHTRIASAAVLAGLLAAGAWSCKGGDGEAKQTSRAEEAPAKPPATMAPAADPAPAAEVDELEVAGGTAKKADKGANRRARDDVTLEDVDGKLEEADGDDRGGSGGERAPTTRAWFPETFLFEPAVITDDRGVASVGVRVPDRLTTWRVLALAHSRGGSQAGAVTSFLGTLPAYVDPVVPPFLRAGDQVRVPIQLVNTTADPVTAPVVVEAAGAALSGGAFTAALPARGSVVRYVTLRAEKPGTIRLLARLGESDAVVRTIDVRPRGRPVIQRHSGTLAAPRSVPITVAEAADPELDRARLTVFPGALAILRSELAASASRGGVADDAFALLLAGRAPELLRALGDQPDTGALRDLTLLTTQRVVRHARVFDTTTATLLAEAALSHPDNPVLTRLGERAVNHLARNQSPDGTCGGESGWTVQRLLVATADCVRGAAGERTVVVRASGAFERHAEHVQDPYTAAAMLAAIAAMGDAGATGAELAEALREKVRAGVEERPDGSRVLAVPTGVVRADGTPPSPVEATALAVLALQGDAGAPLADLGATLLAGYSPAAGWGDGRANLVCLQAVLRLFKDPIPETVTISLAVDDRVIAEGELDRDRVREVLTLDASGFGGAAGSHQWHVRAEPPVPGLGFSLAVTSFVPWQTEPGERGVQLTVTPPDDASVGKPAELNVRAAVPSGYPFTITLALPAAVQVDEKSLDALVASGVLAGYETSDGEVELRANPLPPAQVFSAVVRVIPTLGGTLHSGPATIDVSGGGEAPIHVPPRAWKVD